MKRAQAKGGREAEGRLGFGARHKITGILRGVAIGAPIVKIPRPPSARLRDCLDHRNGEQGGVAVGSETDFPSGEHGTVGERMKGSISSTVVSAPNRKGCLTHVDVAPSTGGEGTPCANCRGIKTALHDVNRVDVAQHEPNLDHVPGFEVIGAEGGNGNKGKTVCGHAFVNDVTFGLFHGCDGLV